MRACIRRGAAAIGGSCVEVEHNGARLVLDLGLPLEADEDDTELPVVLGDDLLGVVISHAHPDHMGLVARLPATVPVYGPAVAQRMLEAGGVFTGAARGVFRPWRPLTDGQPLRIGPFIVTALAVDHSAYESYALLVEAGGRRLLYTGDLRAHGRKPGMWRRLLDEPPRPVHTLLLEGTTLSRDGGPSLTEGDVESGLTALCEQTAGLVLVSYSGQHIDRLVSVFRAAKRSGRILVLDAYGAAIAAATERQTIPQGSWEGVRVLLPHAQRARIIKAEAFDAIAPFKTHRIYAEELRERASEIVLTMRGSMTRDLDRADCLTGAAAVWSMWAGYLGGDSGQRFTRWLDGHGIALTQLHASGHANVEDLVALATAIAPERVVPIHTSVPERFSELFSNVRQLPDGDHWEV